MNQISHDEKTLPASGYGKQKQLIFHPEVLHMISNAVSHDEAKYQTVLNSAKPDRTYIQNHHGGNNRFDLSSSDTDFLKLKHFTVC